MIGLNFNFNGVEKCYAVLKIILKLSENNNSGSGSRPPQPPEANGGLGADSPTLRRLFSLFQKIMHLKHILV